MSVLVQNLDEIIIIGTGDSIYLQMDKETVEIRTSAMSWSAPPLGVYSTIERAREVLRELFDCLAECRSHYVMPEC